MKIGKRMISLLLIIAILFTTIPTYALAQEPNVYNLTTEVLSETKISIPFTDVNESDWFYDSVVYAYKNQIFNGTTENTFSPRDGMTRSMYVTVLGRFAGIDPAEYVDINTGFKDVAVNAYYAPYVAWAVEKGITTGIGEQIFDIDGLVTRQQMAVFTERFFKAYDIPYLANVNREIIPPDLDSVSLWARESVLNLYQAGILQGDQYGNFNPNTTAIRAEAATVFMSVDNLLDARGVAIPKEEDSAVILEDKNKERGSNGGSPKDPTPIDPTDPEKPITTKYKISFYIDGKTSIDPIFVSKGEPSPSLPIPNKPNSLFLGWYKEPSFLNRFEDNTLINGNITLYARYNDESGNFEEISSIYQIAAEEPVSPNFSIKLNSSLNNADDVLDKLQFICTGGVDDRGISVTGGDGSFTVSMPGGFKPGADYRLTLLDESISFEGKDRTAKDYYFHIEKEEIENLVLNEDIVYIPASQISNIYNGDKPIESLSAAIFSFSEDGVEEAEIKGKFTYDGGKILKVGEVLCVYSGESPESDVNTESIMYDDIAYVKVTAVNEKIISYESANPEDVLFIAKTVAIKKDDSFASTDQGFSFEAVSLQAEHTLAMGDIEPIARDITVGDIIVIYDAPSLVNVTQEDIILGTVTEILGSGPFTINCDITTFEELQEGMDYYQDIQLDIGKLEKSGQLDTGMLKEEIRQQTMASGIIDELAGKYAMLSLDSNLFSDSLESSEGLSVLMSDGTFASAGQLQSLMADKSSGKKVEVSDVDVKVETKNGNELGSEAFRAEIKVGFDVTIKTEAGDSIKLTFSIIFIQEISLSIQASAGIDWGWSWGPYIQEAWVNASLSVKTYSGVVLEATLTTKSADSDKTIDISEKINGIIGSNEENDAVENVSDIYKHYQDFMKNDLDYIEIVKQSLFKVNISLALGLVQITVEPSFVVSAAANAAVTCTLSYQEGTKYSFNARLSSASLDFNKSNILDKQFNFDLYLVGRLGLRVGIELELKVGLVSTKLNSMGISAQSGLYNEWSGFFSYEYRRNFTQNTTTSLAQGAMYTELGVYLEIGANFQAGNGKWEKNFGLFSEKYPLLSSNNKDYIYDFSYPQDNAERLLINKEKNYFPDYALKMIKLDLSSGKSFLESYGADRFNIVFTNKAFSLKDGRIEVNTDEDYLETDMSIIWNSSPLAFTSVPIKRTFRVIFSDTENPVEKGMLTVKVNGSHIPELSRLVDFGTSLEDALPNKDEILRLIGYADYERTIGAETLNLRYTGEGKYEQSLSGEVNGSKEFEYNLPLREYTVQVEDVQKINGDTTTVDRKTIYGGSFDLSQLEESKTEIAGKTYTKFFNVETRNDKKEVEGQSISGLVREALAIQILSGKHTYHATYVDNSSIVEYRFLTLTGNGIERNAEVLKRNTRPTFDYKEYVEDEEYLIYGDVDGDVLSPVNGNRTIYISCIPNDGYPLIFVKNGGIFAEGYTPLAMYDPEKGTTLPTGEDFKDREDNLVFAGWYENSDFSGSPVTIAKGNMGPKTYHALWVGPQYTIKFDGMGGVGNMEEVSGARFGEDTTLKESTFVVDRYKIPHDTSTPVFLGWNTQIDGSGIFYEDKATILTPLGVNSSGILTLYAQWDDFKVSYTPSNSNAPVHTGKMALLSALKYAEQYPGTITMEEKIDGLSRTIALPGGTTFSGGGYDMGLSSSTGEDDFVIFSVSDVDAVKLDNMKLYREGHYYNKNARIENKGTLTIENSEIYGMIDENGVIYNHESGKVVMRNTIFRSSGTKHLFNAGTMIIDGGLITKSEPSAPDYPAGIITNQGLMVLNNTNYSSNGNSTYYNTHMFNDGGELYILNTSLFNNHGNHAGIVNDNGSIYMVNSLIGSNGLMHGNIGFMSGEEEGYIYNSIYGQINSETLQRLNIENSVYFLDEHIYTARDQLHIKDPALRNNAATVHLDYSDLDDIKIGLSFKGEFKSILNKATESTSMVSKYFGGDDRDLNDNRVGAYYLPITEYEDSPSIEIETHNWNMYTGGMYTAEGPSMKIIYKLSNGLYKDEMDYNEFITADLLDNLPEGLKVIGTNSALEVELKVIGKPTKVRTEKIINLPTSISDVVLQGGTGDSIPTTGKSTLTIEEVKKGRHYDVPTPTVLGTPTENSITVNPITTDGYGLPVTVEYAINTGGSPTESWQESTTFSGLEPNTTYYVWARAVEDDNHFTGYGTPSEPITTASMSVVPTITTITQPDGVVDTAYSVTLKATGDSPITWTLAEGDLPDGLYLSEDGVISGTPTTEGTFNFTVKASNDGGDDTKELSVIIKPEIIPAIAPTITTESLPDGVVNTAYSETLVASGDSPITWTLDDGTLPDGLSLSDEGIISGTSTTAGTFEFTVKASNNVSPDASKAFSIKINTEAP